jgi:TolB-like protein
MTRKVVHVAMRSVALHRFESLPAGRRRREALARHATHLAVVLLAGACGCAAGRAGLETGVPPREHAAGDLPVLQAAVLADPRDARAQRELGIAWFDVARHDAPDSTRSPADSALVWLQRARDADGADARTLYFLGATHEMLGHLDEAMATYRDYAALRPERAERRAIEARIATLLRQKLTHEAEAAIRHEQGIQRVARSDSVVAVPPFSAVDFPDSMGAIGRGLADLIAADLARIGSLQLLERDRVDVLIRELELVSRPEERGIDLTGRDTWWPISDIHGVKQVLRALVRPSTGEPYYAGPIDESLGPDFVAAVKAFQADRGGLSVTGKPDPVTQVELTRVVDEVEDRSQAWARGFQSGVDSTTAPLLGKMLRARTIVTGSVARLPDERLRVDVLVVPLEGATHGRGSVADDDALANIFALEKRIVRGIVDALGLEPTAEEWLAIEQNRPTESLAAFLAWSTGLDLEARDRRDAAHAAFARAADLDASFASAQQAAERTAAAPPPQPPPPEPPPSDGLGGRLGGTATSVGLGQQSGPTGSPVAVEDGAARRDQIPEPPPPPRPR